MRSLLILSLLALSLPARRSWREVGGGAAPRDRHPDRRPHQAPGYVCPGDRAARHRGEAVRLRVGCRSLEPTEWALAMVANARPLARRSPSSR